MANYTPWKLRPFPNSPTNNKNNKFDLSSRSSGRRGKKIELTFKVRAEKKIQKTVLWNSAEEPSNVVVTSFSRVFFRFISPAHSSSTI